MIELFGLGGLEVTREQVSNWLKKDEDESYQSCSDTQLASFLNGLIIDKRGKKDGPEPVPEKTLINNKPRAASVIVKSDVAKLGMLDHNMFNKSNISN